jgi:membrane-associated phospholipid phosphatase
MIHSHFICLLKGLSLLLADVLIYNLIYLRQRHKHEDFFYKIPRISLIDNMPYRPFTFSFYLSWFFYMIVVFLFVHHTCHNQLFFSFLFNFLLSACAYVLFPSYYPNKKQSCFSELERRNTTAKMGNWWHDVVYKKYVKPGSKGVVVAPSLHTSIPWVAAFLVMLTEKMTHRAIILIVWSVAISISTLTTKQHYFFDLISGITVASISVLCSLYYSHYQLNIMVVILLFFIMLCDMLKERKKIYQKK